MRPNATDINVYTIEPLSMKCPSDNKILLQQTMSGIVETVRLLYNKREGRFGSPVSETWSIFDFGQGRAGRGARGSRASCVSNG